MTRSERGKQRLEEAADRLVERRDAAIEQAVETRDAAAERLVGTRDAAVERMAEARESAADNLATAKAAAADQIAKVKPRLRGVSHEYAFFVSLVLGVGLILLAKGAEARVAAGIYAASLSALFGVSALYHVHDWQPAARRWMRRLDHTMIFFVIAGTVTPFAVLLMHGPFATGLLIAVWAGALAGTIIELVWLDSPKWVSSIVYVVVGAIGAIGFPAIAIEAGPVAGILIATGGVIYAGGAIVYAVQRPNPSPAVFGYHEIFHVMVIAAAATHFAAVALYALPAA